MTETVASPEVKQNLPVAEEAQEELVYEFEVNIQRFSDFIALNDKLLAFMTYFKRN